MVNAFLVLFLAVCIVLAAVYLNKRRRRRSAHRAKARIIELSRSASTRNLMELQADLKELLQELSSPHLILVDVMDHNDRADAYRLVADLQVNLMQFIDAEKNYRAAIDCYNEALKLEADNQVAISSKFKTVEALRDLERIRF